MASSKEKRSQRHQAQIKQNINQANARTKVTEQVAGVGYRETQYIGGKKYYTPLSTDPNIAISGSSSVSTALGSSSSVGISSHGGLVELLDDDHTQYVLVDGTRAFSGNWTNAGNTVANLGTITTVDINGGTIDGVTIGSGTINGDLTWSSDQTGVSSLTLANSKNIDLTTGNITFTPTANDTLIISSTTHGASTIATTDANGTNASLTLDADGDIILDPHTGDVKVLKAGSWYGAKLIPNDDNTFIIHSGDGNDEGTLTLRSEGGTVSMSAYDPSGPTETTRFRFLLDSTPELDVTGDFKIDGSGDITLDPADGNVYLRDGTNNIFDFNVAEPGVTIYDDADQNDYFKIKVNQNGATIFSTTDNYMADADLTFDIDGDIILDAFDNDIFFKHDGAERFRMDLDSTPTLAVTGAFDLDASSTVTIDSTSTFLVKTNSNNVIEANTSGNIYFHAYPQDVNFNNYKLNTLSDKYHFTTGQADFKQNFTMLAYFEERTTASEYEPYPTGTP
tara:strand:+ start:3907 stop:5430 length:1524 start_codon:yes stop_codon:yes gene_type:complete